MARRAGDVTHSPDQNAAIHAAVNWYHHRRRNHFRLEGPAGSGKTTITRAITDQCAPKSTAYLAPTGKAAAVLRAKGCDGATTVHSAIYAPAGERTTILNALRNEQATLNPHSARAIELERQIERVRQQPSFTLRAADKAFGGKRPNLIVVDEASMVDDKMFNDLVSYRIPVLFLGDPYQLGPVRPATANWRKSKPDALLTTIHRGADTAPILDLATVLRNGGRPPAWNGTAGATPRSWTPIKLAEYDQIIVGKKVTRWLVINAVRESRGLPSGSPMPGDRIMCLRNDPAFNVINGQQATVRSATEADGAYCLEVTTDTGEDAVWLVDERGFIDQAGQDAARNDRDGELVAATFAQAITCHSAQGSQWPRVAVVNEEATFRAESRNWLYTAATRAERSCVIVDPTKMILPPSTALAARQREISDRLNRQARRQGRAA